MFVGEPEDALVALAGLDSLDHLFDVPSITFRNNGAITPHRAHGQYTGFPQAPSPAWDLLALEHYALPMVNKPYVLVETSRGCPYTCDFCVAPIHQGHKFRERSAKALVDEIERLHRELGLDFFYLWGDTVTLNVKSFTAFCDELIARNLPIQWFGNARADNLTDPAFVHRLKKAGCWMLALGIETESEEVRKDMTKRLERQKIQAAFKNMRDAGVKSFANKLVKDHTAANNELESLMKKKNITARADEKPATEAWRNDTGAAFDRAYIDHAIAEHEKDIAAFEAESKDGSDAELKAWATGKLPALREHLKMARDLKSKLAS